MNEPESTTPPTEPVTTTPNAEVPDGPWKNPRLPTNLVPIHYEVEFQVDLKPDSSGDYWFEGRGSVLFHTTQNTNVLIVHSNRLSIIAPSVMDEKVSDVYQVITVF